MITGINSRMFRTQTMTVGVRQQVVTQANPAMSKRMVRQVTIMLCVGLLIVFAASQFMHGWITTSVSQLDQLQLVRNNSGSENISLLAKRAQLASKDYVTRQVSSKFQLFVPGKDQVHRL